MSDMNNKTLKPGWRQVKFGEVVRQCKEKADPETSGLERYIAGEHMDTDDLRLRRWGEIGSGYLGPAFHMRFKPGQVLYGSRRTYLRKVAVADFDGICANTTFVLEPKNSDELLPDFLPFLMQTDSFNDFSIKNSKGSVNPYINFSDLAKYEFALPPIEYQGALLSVLRQIEETIEAALTLLGAAVEVMKSQVADAIADLQTVQIGTVCKFRGGNAFSPDLQGRKAGKIPFIKVSDMNLPANRLKIVEAENYVDSNDIQKMRAKPFEAGSVVFAKVGAALFLNRRRMIVTPTCIDNNMMGAIPDSSKITPDYLFLVLQQIDFKTIVQEGAIPSVNQGTLEKVLIPFAPLDRQKEIVSSWQEADDAVQKINARLEANKQLKSQTLALMSGGHY